MRPSEYPKERNRAKVKLPGVLYEWYPRSKMSEDDSVFSREVIGKVVLGSLGIPTTGQSVKSDGKSDCL